MKSLLLSLIIICFSWSLHAQEVPSKSRHELSLNTALLQNFFTSSENITPYTLSYKWIWTKHAIRVGVGGDYFQESDTEPGFADSETTLRFGLDARLGFEWRKKWGNLLAYGGGDVTWTQTHDKFIVDSGFDKVTNVDQINGLGFGPVVGLQYYFNEHLSISTEGAAYLFFKEKTTAQLFQNFPEFDDVLDFSQISELQKILPASIYINYTF